MNQLVACSSHLLGLCQLPDSLVLTDIVHQDMNFHQIFHNISHFALWDLLTRSDSNLACTLTERRNLSANVANLCAINLNVFYLFVCILLLL